MAKRHSKTIITGVTRLQAEDAMAAYAAAQAEIDKITAQVELQCIDIRNNAAPDITRLQKQIEEAHAMLEAYATENRETIFAKRRSLELPNGTIGFRTATPKVKAVKGYTLAAALQLMRSFCPRFVRQTEELDRQKLILERDDNDTQTALQKCGLQIVQEETFFVSVPEEKLA